MKRVLITGANSFVGTNIEKWLLKNPKDFSVDNLSDHNPIVAGFSINY